MTLAPGIPTMNFRLPQLCACAQCDSNSVFKMSLDQYVALARAQAETLLQHELARPAAMSLLSVVLAVLLLRLFASRAGAGGKEGAGGSVYVGGVRRSTRTSRQAKLYSEEFIALPEDPAAKTPRATVSPRAGCTVWTEWHLVAFAGTLWPISFP